MKKKQRCVVSFVFFFLSSSSLPIFSRRPSRTSSALYYPIHNPNSDRRKSPIVLNVNVFFSVIVKVPIYCIIYDFIIHYIYC